MLTPLICRGSYSAAKRGGWPTKIDFILSLGPALFNVHRWMALSRCIVILPLVENNSLAAMPAETRVLAVMLSENAPSQGK